ncbi:hypothetical protein IFR04_015698 [Cadophora malorum]|uniref:Uncharacterized protein n=1 Tax=Cadophora malorum TaxID=108018 RepID=A0A8H7T2E5_9HELO|nr:hypothetical protein IFR04_015698 [Cadophora malorum]
MEQLAQLKGELRRLYPMRGSQEVTHSDNALPDYMEDPSQTASIPPETVGIGPTLSNEALQDLVEVRNELKNGKEANAKAFREMQDMFQ